MCQVMIGTLIASDTSKASWVLPVPGSPLIRSGRSRVMAALTATRKSLVAMYLSVPSKRIVRASLQQNDEISVLWTVGPGTEAGKAAGLRLARRADATGCSQHRSMRTESGEKSAVLLERRCS